MFVYVLNCFKIHEQKQFMDALTAKKQKSCVDDSCLLQSLYSRKVAETTIFKDFKSYC